MKFIRLLSEAMRTDVKELPCMVREARIEFAELNPTSDNWDAEVLLH